jgi:ceramidase
MSIPIEFLLVLLGVEERANIGPSGDERQAGETRGKRCACVPTPCDDADPMQMPSNDIPLSTRKNRVRRRWREMLLVVLGAGAFLALLAADPIPQDPRYHDFADARTLIGIRNFANVVSNVPFLVVGMLGLILCVRSAKRRAARAWITFFAGVALVCFGSGYYHATPSNTSLVWDRLPMTLAFMGLFVAVVGEHVGASVERYLLAPTLLAGFASIAWWNYTDDLRWYVGVQFVPLLLIATVLLLFDPPYTHRRYVWYGLGMYLLAKVAEFYDAEIFERTARIVSGHSLKHLFAAASTLCIYWMLRQREPLTEASVLDPSQRRG